MRRFFTGLVALTACSQEAELAQQEVTSSSLALSLCAEGETVEGIDVSRYNGDIDWDRVAATGIGFAIARVSDGVTLDTKFRANWPEMQRVGLVRGVYQFYRPLRDPVEQADLLLTEMGALAEDGRVLPLGPSDLPPVLDVEWTTMDASVGAEAMSVGIAAWIARVEEVTGRVPIIYTNSYYWDAEVDSALFADSPLWIAHYGTSCPRVPNTGWDRWAIHQYTGSGALDGIEGDLDRNRFNGTLEDLRAMTFGDRCAQGCAGDIATRRDCSQVDCAASDEMCIVDGDQGLCAPAQCAEGSQRYCSEGSVVICAAGQVTQRVQCVGNRECATSRTGAACVVRASGGAGDAAVAGDASVMSDAGSGEAAVTVDRARNRKPPGSSGCVVAPRVVSSPHAKWLVLAGWFLLYRRARRDEFSTR